MMRPRKELAGGRQLELLAPSLPGKRGGVFCNGIPDATVEFTESPFLKGTRLATSLTRCLLLAAITGCCLGSARADIKLIGSVAIPATATDKSGLTDTLADGTPHNRIGAHGSGIAWTGQGNRYVMVADRGPSDGTVPFRCRFHVYQIEVTEGPSAAVKASLISTSLLSDEHGQPFIGLSSSPMRLDPEGVRVGPKGTLFISDEYGPFVGEFDLAGKRIRSLPVPAKFLIAHTHPDEKKEIAANTSGRVTNKGMEGLAITPDGSKLVGCMQASLIQDGGRDAQNVRILEIDVASGKTREFVYQRERQKTGISEIIAINANEYLVLERDGKAGTTSKIKKLFRIDLTGATDVSSVERLPKSGLPAGVVPVKKSEFLDFLDPKFGLFNDDLPGKIEGLAFGPDLPDGRHLLLVTSDNDLSDKNPTWIYAFAVGPKDLPGFQQQSIRLAASRR
jgi:hypothetical protein